MQRGLIYCAMLALAGCGASPAVVRVPVEAERVVYVPIDAQLTAHGGIPGPGDVPLPPNCRPGTGCEVIAVASARKAGMAQCHGQLDAIRAIEGSDP